MFIKLDLKSDSNPIIGKNYVKKLNIGFIIMDQEFCGIYASDHIKVFFNSSGKVKDEYFELLGEIFECRLQMERKFKLESFFFKDNNVAEYIKIVCYERKNWVV